MQSTLDQDVKKILSDTNHIWETIDGIEYCKRCGQPKDSVKLPDKGFEFLPCKGFIG